MKLFETALESFWFLGMEWDDHSQKFLISITKNVYAYCISIMCITSTTLYLIFDARSFDEYTEALFVCSTAIMCTIITTFICIKLKLLSEFIKSSRMVVNESK